MARRERSNRDAWLGTAMVIVAAAVAAVAVDAMAKTKIRQTLTATVHAPGASGVAKLRLRTPSKGKFTVKAQHLPGGKTFDVVVNKVKVGTLRTGAGGDGAAKFTTAVAGRAAILGFDPRGAQIAIRDDETGDDDLEANMPDDDRDSAIGCCLGTECEEETAAECTAHGGKPTSAGGCLPDPCKNNPPPPKTVCCLTTSAGGAFVDDDPENVCDDDDSSAKCAAKGGVVVKAPSCEPNPCQPTPPPQLVVCCVPDQDEAECEHVTADHCKAEGGKVSSATSCEHDPCGGGDDDQGDDNQGDQGGDDGGHMQGGGGDD
jgi:hypothetical protein